jgi:hypothetical protein
VLRVSLCSISPLPGLARCHPAHGRAAERVTRDAEHACWASRTEVMREVPPPDESSGRQSSPASSSWRANSGLKPGLITGGGGVMITQAQRIAALEAEIAEVREELGSLQALQRRSEEILRGIGGAELAAMPERLAGVEKQLDVFTLTFALRLMQTGQPVPEGLVNRLFPDIGEPAAEPAARPHARESRPETKHAAGRSVIPFTTPGLRAPADAG